jgi:beta-glucosidase
VFVGYRGYEHSNKEPLFPFGYGLSYTTFKYSNVTIEPIKGATGGPKYKVSFDIKNTGTRAGADVAQVYVGDSHSKIPRPTKELKGFAKVTLQPGETKRASVILDGRSLAYYDAAGKHWNAEAGDFDVMVGRSSSQIELKGKLTLSAADASTIK